MFIIHFFSILVRGFGYQINHDRIDPLTDFTRDRNGMKLLSY